MFSTKIRRPTRVASAQSPAPNPLAPRALLAGSLALLLVACTPSNNGGGGGNQGKGGSSNGGSQGTGGSSNGGNQGTGGSGSGGKASGGSAGSNNGGSSSGGSAGSNNGGSSSGGSAGSNNGGSNNGGAAGNAGGAAGTPVGGSGGGSTSTGDRPAGYYKTSDWGVSKVDWHGCVWTGKDSTVSGSDTSVTPVDFMTGTPNGGPYHVSGTVFNDYNAVALLGFNIGEAANGKADQCKNDPTSGTKDGPPAVTMPSSATGIAVNWSATKLPLDFRIQIQGVKGGSDATQRWCAGIKDASGPSFVPFSDFSTTCWNTTGTKYNNEPIDAVAFLVPGTTTAKKPFDITIVGFAPGTKKEDAPGKAADCGTKTGTVGTNTLLSDSTKATDASMERAATQGKDCKMYIVNNNNWGSKGTTYQQLSFTGNSFKVDAANGTATGQGVPASFPSLYVGGNGNIGGGAFNTWSDTGLPKQISAMGSANSTFKWGGKTSGDFNVTYDIWFAKSPPTAGGYNDGISGLLMVWLYKPGSRSPIGGSPKRQANIGGNDFDVWIGPRATQSAGTDDSGRPVISYVAKSTITNFSADLKAFFDDAVKNGDADKSAGGTSQAFSSNWYLTDVFGGFELWSAGDGVGLQASEFTFALK
jgi:hypothetical protein